MQWPRRPEASAAEVGELLADAVAKSGAAELEEALPLDLLLGLRNRMTRADRRMVLAASETLQHLPVTRGLFAEGRLSWGQIRGITGAVRRLTVEQRAEVDARIEATVAEHGGVDAFVPDGLVDAVLNAGV